VLSLPRLLDTRPESVCEQAKARRAAGRATSSHASSKVKHPTTPHPERVPPDALPSMLMSKSTRAAPLPRGSLVAVRMLDKGQVPCHVIFVSKHNQETRERCGAVPNGIRARLTQ
jgi:hypothetical protein